MELSSEFGIHDITSIFKVKPHLFASTCILLLKLNTELKSKKYIVNCTVTNARVGVIQFVSISLKMYMGHFYIFEDHRTTGAGWGECS